MSRHTPAPWKIEPDRGDCKVIAISNPGDGWERLYVEVDSDDCDRETARANARLIAAAPMQHDLLVALAACKSDNKPVREWAEKYGIDLGNATNGRVLDKAIAAAISLAERGAE